jgi:hypothetical protein
VAGSTGHCNDALGSITGGGLLEEVSGRQLARKGCCLELVAPCR